MQHACALARARALALALQGAVLGLGLQIDRLIDRLTIDKWVVSCRRSYGSLPHNTHICAYIKIDRQIAVQITR